MSDSPGLTHLEIIGTGSYVPEEIVRTDSFEGRDMWAYDLRGARTGEARQFTTDKLVELTGIYERRKSRPDEWSSDMGLIAARRALEMAGVTAEGLIGIVVATVSEKQNFPSAAQKIQLGLGARNVRIAYDAQNACAGFPLALKQANALSRDDLGYWLVVASECLTKINDYTDINSHLFGDAAGAVVARSIMDMRRGILATQARSDPFNGNIDMIFKDRIDGCIRMPDGSKVLKAAVPWMVESARDLKEQLGWERADVYIVHQANERIIAGVEKKVQAEGGAMYRTISKYGNPSAASCAISLDEAVRDGTIRRSFDGTGSKVIITAVGASMIGGGVAVQF
jgi:3-oxoacyl-[acyl-carrier-protein] synthase III